MADNLDLRLDNLFEKFSRRSDLSELKFRLVQPDKGIDYSWQSPTSSNTHLIASSTKMFAATVVAQLCDEGTLSLDDPLSKFLPAEDLKGLNNYSGIDQSPRIIVRDILAHSSGIADYYQTKRLPKKGDLTSISENDPGWDYQKTLEIAKKLPANFPPGSNRAHYSATNYQLVGALIEQLTGSSFSEQIEKRITEPLGLRNTAVLTRANLELMTKASTVLIGRQIYKGSRRIASLGAEGAIISSTEDTTSFIRAFFEGELISRSIQSELLSNWLPVFQRVNYGAGVMELKLPRFLTRAESGVRYFGHAGATGHLMFYDPQSRLSVVGTINQLKPSRVPYRLMIAALRIVNSS